MNLSQGDLRTSLPPRWALGYHESYATAPDPRTLVAVARRFGNQDVPLESLQITPPQSGSDRSESGGDRWDAAVDSLRTLGIKTRRSTKQSAAESTSAGRLPTDRPNARRPFVLTAAVEPNTRRDAAVSFPAPLSRTDPLEWIVTRCLDLTRDGYPFCGPELQFDDGRSDPVLTVRALQLAVFCPLLRVRFAAAALSSERLWPFEPQVTDLWRRYLGLRYKLVPYIYTAFDTLRRGGEAPIRALAADAAGPTSQPVDRQFFLGSSLLVAPVLNPSNSNRSVYLPDGTWYRFWTNESYGGDQTISETVPLDRIPVFARAGSVIPLHPYMSRIDSHQPSTLVLRAYPGSGQSNEVYVDDGQSYEFLTGDYHRLTIETRQQQNLFSLTLSRDGRRDLPYEQFEWQLPLQSVRSASLDGRRLEPHNTAEEFVAANHGTFRGSYFFRIRTPPTARSLEISFD